MFKFTSNIHKTKFEKPLYFLVGRYICFLNRKKTKLNCRTSKELRFFFQIIFFLFRFYSIEIAAHERIPLD